MIRKTKIICLLMILAMAGIATAEQQGNLPVDFFQNEHRPLRIVSGGLCTDLPDDAGTTLWFGFEVFCTGAQGVTDDLTGCVVHFRNAERKLIKEVELRPGEKAIAPDEAAFWERYNCYNEPYTCTNYVSKGCGKSGSYAECDDDQMLRVRTCRGAPDGVETERCIDWYECFTEHCTYSESTWSACENGVRTRKITEADCSTWTDKEACTINCKKPAGVPGDLICQNGQMIECNANGQWKNTGLCSSGGDCKDPSGSIGDTVCLDGFEKACKSGSWEKTGEYCTLNEGIEETFTTAFYDPSKEGIVVRVGLKNTGEDMKDTYILEIQPRPEGHLPLAFQSEQQACDPSYPENVHKQFMLGAGEEDVYEFLIPESILSDGRYDVYALTRHKCYADLTSEQAADHDEYNRVPPYPAAKLISTVEIGNEDDDSVLNTGKVWLVLGIAFVLASFVVLIFIGPYALIPLAIGVIMVIKYFIA